MVRHKRHHYAKREVGISYFSAMLLLRIYIILSFLKCHSLFFDSTTVSFCLAPGMVPGPVSNVRNAAAPAPEELHLSPSPGNMVPGMQ